MQALLRHLPVHAGPAAGVGDRLPAADAAVARDPSTTQAKVARRRRLLARTDLQGKVATTFAPVVNATSQRRRRRAALMEKVTGIAKDGCCRRSHGCGSRSGSAAATHGRRREPRATVALFPTCLVEYQEPDDRQGAGRRATSATASRASCPRVRCAAACRGSTPATSTSSATPRERNVDALAARGRGRARSIVVPAAHVRVHAEGRVPRLPRHRRDAEARRRAHLRRVGVPHRTRTARSRSTRTSTGTTYEIDPVARGVPLPRAADRPEEPQLMAAHRREGARWSSGARRSTARGGCGPRTSSWRSGSPSR